MTREDFIKELQFAGWTSTNGKDWYKTMRGVPRLFKLLKKRVKAFSNYVEEEWKFSSSFAFSDLHTIDAPTGVCIKVVGGTVIWRL